MRRASFSASFQASGGTIRTGQYVDYRDLSAGGDLWQWHSVLSERPGLSQNQFLATCLQAMGVDADRSLRASVGWPTTHAEVDRFAAAFPDVVNRLRALRGDPP